VSARSLAAVSLVVLAPVLLGYGASEASAAAPCRISDFRVSFGPELTPPSGRSALVLRLRNRGPSCRVRGYPTVALLDRKGRALPVVYRRGGGMMVTPLRPKLVDVRRGGIAWVVLEQFKCDLGGARNAGAAVVGLPGATGTVRLRLTRWGHYCGKGDPGSFVGVSPVARTLRGALQR
jgi:hypothetical protein